MKMSTSIHDVPRIAGTSIAVILKEASSTRIGGLKILLGELVVDTADGVCGIVRAVRSTVYSWLDKLAIDKLKGRAIDSESVVGPAMKPDFRNNNGGMCGPHSCTIELQAVRI